MKYRLFGNTDVRVSEIGLGCSTLGKGVFYRDDQESIRVLNLAFDRGINFYDTADSYGFGHSEELIGRTFKKRRSQVIIATKGGMLPSSLARVGKWLLPILKPVRPILQSWKTTLKNVSKKRQDFSSDYIIQAVENSLKRLQTDYLDLYQLHSPPTAILEHGGVFETLDSLKRQGKIRFYGVSANTIDDAVLCLKNPNISSLQVAFNLLEQQAITELFPQVSQRGIAVVARIPLGRGLLTEKMTVQTGHFLKEEEQQLANTRIQTLLPIFQGERRSLAEVALQFVLRFSEVSVVIPGTKKAQHLEQNLRALQAPSLTKEEMDKIPLFC